MDIGNFGNKVLDYFLNCSEKKDTILFVIDDEIYNSFFDDDSEKDEFEKSIKQYVNDSGLSFITDEYAVALAAHQMKLSLSAVINTITSSGAETAINRMITETYFDSDDSTILYQKYYRLNGDNTDYQKKLWDEVKCIFAKNQRYLTDANVFYTTEYQKYILSQIKPYRECSKFNVIFKSWGYTDEYEQSGFNRKISSDDRFSQFKRQFFGINSNLLLKLIWSFYRSWFKKSNDTLKRTAIRGDSSLYIELFDNPPTFDISDVSVFDSSKNKIDPSCSIFYCLFNDYGSDWWKAAVRNDIPNTGSFVILIQSELENRFSTTNRTTYTYRNDTDCSYTVLKYTAKPDDILKDLTPIPQLIGGVRIRQNTYLNVNGLEPSLKGRNSAEIKREENRKPEGLFISLIDIKTNKELLHYKLISGKNIPNTTGKSSLSNIDGLFLTNIQQRCQQPIQQIQNTNGFCMYDGSYTPPTSSPVSFAHDLFKFQDALCTWLAYKGEATLTSIHAICLNMTENCGWRINDPEHGKYPEYRIFLPLFMAGIIERYNVNGRYLYRLSPQVKLLDAVNTSYEYQNHFSTGNGNNSVSAINYLSSINSLAAEIQSNNNNLFEHCNLTSKNNRLVRYATSYPKWNSDDNLFYNNCINDSNDAYIFKASKNPWDDDYICMPDGQTYRLNDSESKPWHPLTWNICESYINYASGVKRLFEYYKQSRTLICNDFTSLPVSFARALILNNPAKLQDDELYLSYCEGHKKQVFENVGEDFLNCLISKYTEISDTIPLLLSLQKDSNDKDCFYITNYPSFTLSNQKSVRVFKYVKLNNEWLWYSIPGNENIPDKEPFAILADGGYCHDYLYNQNYCTRYENMPCKQTSAQERPMVLFLYTRLPDDFFTNKLNYYPNIILDKIQNKNNIRNGVINNNKKDRIMDGLIPLKTGTADPLESQIYTAQYSNDDFTNITFKGTSVPQSPSPNKVLQNNFSKGLFYNDPFFNQHHKDSVTSIEFMVKHTNQEYSLSEYTILDVKPEKIKKPFAADVERWNSIKQAGGRPENTLGYATQMQKDSEMISHTLKMPTSIKILDSKCGIKKAEDCPYKNEVFSYQEDLYNWLKQYHSVTEEELHDFCIKKVYNSKFVNEFGLNPEVTIGKPLERCGIIDKSADGLYYISSSLTNTQGINVFSYRHHLDFIKSMENKTRDLALQFLYGYNCPRVTGADNLTYYRPEKRLVCKNFLSVPKYYARAIILNNPEILATDEYFLCACKGHEQQIFNAVEEEFVIELSKKLK